MYAEDRTPTYAEDRQQAEIVRRNILEGPPQPTYTSSRTLPKIPIVHQPPKNRSPHMDLEID
jgi:hypothetical protein